MTRSGRLLRWAGIIALIWAASPHLRAEPPAKLRVLILSGQNNHDWKATTPALKRILEESGRFVVEVTEQPQQGNAETFKRCDVIVSNWNTFGDGAKVKEWPEAMRSGLLDFVSDGGGFVVAHAGGAMFPEWTEFHKLIGATWGKGTGHGARHVFEVKITDPNHPVTRDLRPFTTFDELWHRMAGQPDKKVLATAFSDKNSGGSGADEPMVMATEYGKGRCFNLVLGHDVTAMGTPGFRLLLQRGTEWAATGKVTIAASTIPTEAQMDAALKAAAEYRFGATREALSRVEGMVHAVSGDAAARQVFAAKLAALLSSEATTEARQFACRQLSLVGGAAEVPVLAKLLGDKEIGFFAREALERIPGDESLKAMREALASTSGAMRIGLINSLGELRDEKAVSPIAEAMAESDTQTAAAAMSALGRIGGEQALQTLGKTEAGVSEGLRAAWRRALLQCAHGLLAAGRTEKAVPIYEKLSQPDQPRHIRVAAFPGYVACLKDQGSAPVLKALEETDAAMQAAAVQAMKETQSEALVQAVIARLESLAPEVQAQVIALFGERRETTALPAATKAATSPDAGVQRAALTALGSLGDATTVSTLAGFAEGADAQEKKIILDSLSRLQGEGVDEEMIVVLRKAAPAAQCELIRALVARGAKAAVPALLESAGSPEAEVRREAIAALGKLGDLAVVERLIQMMNNGAEGDRGAFEGALAAICRRAGTSDPVVAALSKEGAGRKRSLLAVLGALGGDKALEAVRAAAKADDADVQAAAVKAMADWPDAAPLDDLFAIATTTDDARRKVFALRGVARLAPTAKDRTADKTVEMLALAMAAATRDEEKKVLLSALGAMPSPAAMRTAEAHLGDPALADEAALTVVQAAEAVWQDHRDEAKRAVQKAMQAGRNPVVNERGASLMLRIEAPENLARGGAATSPDGLDADGHASGDAAAIDGNPNTYWDEKDGQKLYVLRVQLRRPATVSAIRILGFQHHNYAPKDFEVLCDDAVVKKVQDAQYRENLLTVLLPPTPCSAVELRITGYYGRSPAIRELEVFGKPPDAPEKEAQGRETGLRWEQTESALALLKDGKCVWRLNFERREGKPYFHPLTLPDGTELTWLRPADHVWHRALWLSWKHINGLNYWEEDRRTGMSAGRTEVASVKIETRKDGAARVEMDLSYHPPEAPPVLTEKRTLGVSAPDAAGSYRIDWTSAVTAADKDVKLDRTPLKGQPGGAGHGGYAGLSARMAESTRKWTFRSSEGVSEAGKIHGQPARWLDFSGQTAAGGEGGLCILDHPQNLRHPTPWYVARGMPYFSPAFLFKEPHTLPAGSRLTLRYRILVHAGILSPDVLEKEWGEFAKSTE